MRQMQHQRGAGRWGRCWVLLAALLLATLGCWADDAPATPPAVAPPAAASNVIFVMTDGLRWQEVFGGAEEVLISAQAGGVQNVAALKSAYWRATPEERRAVLMPFLWRMVAAQGQLFGNRKKDSSVAVTNGFKFSYPGYQETLCGFADPRIDRNNFGLNPNVTVLEWLAQRPGFAGRVAAFAAWQTFDQILNRARCGYLVNAGNAPLTALETPEVALLNRLKVEVPSPFNEEPPDALTYHTALAYLKAKQPRVLFLSLGETDEWSHRKRYDQYLGAAQRVDGYLQELWETAQSLPQYRGHTTLIVAPDHGRGSTLMNWTDHGVKVEGAEATWLAIMGPGVAPLGERTQVPPVLQTQLAATLAACLGEDYAGAVPRAGKPLAAALASQTVQDH